MTQNINEKSFINLNSKVEVVVDEVVDEIVIETEKGQETIKDELPEIDKGFIEEYIKEENSNKEEETTEKEKESIEKEKPNQEKERKEENEKKHYSLKDIFKEIIEEFGIFLKSKVDEKLLETVKEEIKRKVKEKGGICEIIFLEKTTREIEKLKVITSLTYYVLLFYNSEIKFTQITQRVKENKETTFIETKERYKLLEVGDIDSFGLYEEEGDKKLFIKYKDGRIIELKNLDEDIKQALIFWLKENNLLLDLKVKYGIFGEKDKLILNIFSENVKLKFSNPYNKEIKEEWVGSFNPYKKYVPYFLPERDFNKEIIYTFRKEFVDLLKEGFVKYPKVRIVLSYAFACIIKDWIKDSLSLFPHLWIFNREGGTGKSTLLLLLKTLTAQKSFETGMSIAQVRNLLSVRNNVVVIDDIEDLGDSKETKRIIASLLKASATDGLTITLGDGNIFKIHSPLAVTSNNTPKESIYVDDALLQRLILINLSKGEIDQNWFIKIRNIKIFPELKKPNNSSLAISYYIINTINNNFTKEKILEKLEYFQKLVYETFDNVEATRNLIKQGFKINDRRFIDIISLLILGEFLFSKVFNVKIDIVKDIVNFTKILVKDNEAYRGESLLDDILLILLENHTLEYLSEEKDLITNIESLVNITNISTEIPALIKFEGNYYIILSNKFKKKAISEIKEQVDRNYNSIKMSEDIKSIGGIKRKTMISKREIVFSKEKGLVLNIKKEKIYVSIYELPFLITERLKKELINYILFDFDEGSIYIKEELKKGEKNEEN